jgi:hypothetical protein
LRPIPPTLIVSFEAGCSSIRNDKTENGTKAAGGENTSKSIDLRERVPTNTVRRVLEIPRFFVVWLMTETVVDQAAKKISMCQHLKSAVARSACQKVARVPLSRVKGSGKARPPVACSMENKTTGIRKYAV